MYSLDRYKEILEFALGQGRRFVSFEDELSPGDIILRHDVDYSLKMAVEMARINNACGVAGTFFILVQSQIYNAMSMQSMSRIFRILELGQKIGLHINGYKLTYSQARESLKTYYEAFQMVISEIRPVFSWHCPEKEIIEIFKGKKRVKGLINAYSSLFTEDLRYMADSNLRHTVEGFFEALRSNCDIKFQFLFHPFLWVARKTTMLEILAETWRYVIREREEDFILNDIYREKFPDGVPDDVVDKFLDNMTGGRLEV